MSFSTTRPSGSPSSWFPNSASRNRSIHKGVLIVGNYGIGRKREPHPVQPLHSTADLPSRTRVYGTHFPWIDGPLGNLRAAFLQG